MRFKKSALVCVAVAAALSCTVSAADMKWKFDETTSTVSVRGYGMINDATALNQYLDKAKTIDVLEGVTKIDKNVFVDCGEVEEVILPNGFTDIGDNSFSLSGSLKKVVMPDTLKKIGSEAFMGCSALEDFTLPKSLESIGRNAFAECESIKEFKISDENANFKVVDGVVLTKDGSELVLYPPGAESETYTVPDGVTKINSGAFSYNENLSEIIIPDSTVQIDDYAFFFAKALHKVQFGSQIKSIGNYSFYGTKLRGAQIPYGTESIGDYAFKNCDALSNIDIPGTVKQIGENAFYGTADNFVLNGFGAAAAEAAAKEGKAFRETVRVNINGENQEFDTPPIVKNGCTMLPMRKVFEVLGAEVTWDDATQTAFGKKGDIECSVTIGSDKLYKNGEAIKLDAPAEIINDRTLVHIRAVAEAFDAKVGWDDKGLVTVDY